MQKTDFGKISDKYLKNATKKDGAFIYASPSAVHQLEVEDLASRSSLSMSTKNRYLPKAVIILVEYFTEMLIIGHLVILKVMQS